MPNVSTRSNRIQVMVEAAAASPVANELAQTLDPVLAPLNIGLHQGLMGIIEAATENGFLTAEEAADLLMVCGNHKWDEHPPAVRLALMLFLNRLLYLHLADKHDWL